MQHVFKTKVWGNIENPEFAGSSGPGSAVAFNSNTYVPFLRKFIKEHAITSVADLGCGDFRCGPMIYSDLANVQYTGYDAYGAMIESHQRTFEQEHHHIKFRHLEFSSKPEEIEHADLAILKDVIQHWNLSSIYEFLDCVVKLRLFRYILITNCCNQSEDNTNIADGSFRHLSCQFLPLKKYDAKRVFAFASKEVSVIDVEQCASLMNF